MEFLPFGADTVYIQELWALILIHNITDMVFWITCFHDRFYTFEFKYSCEIIVFDSFFQLQGNGNDYPARFFTLQDSI